MKPSTLAFLMKIELLVSKGVLVSLLLKLYVFLLFVYPYIKSFLMSD
jgi:hypothetical protein